MQYTERIPKMVFYIIIGCMYVYAFVTGLAILHIF
jgi:hypothetical protein